MASTAHPRITIEPGKCGGKPCIRGMRIRVSDVLELLANGASFEEILADYPCLDQFDNAARLERLGVGTGIARRAFRGPLLATTLGRFLGDAAMAA
ncbi:MAG: DUF433 domain-containing protein, partial [Planctomycetia bacterium]